MSNPVFYGSYYSVFIISSGLGVVVIRCHVTVLEEYPSEEVALDKESQGKAEEHVYAQKYYEQNKGFVAQEDHEEIHRDEHDGNGDIRYAQDKGVLDSLLYALLIKARHGESIVKEGYKCEEHYKYRYKKPFI